MKHTGLSGRTGIAAVLSTLVLLFLTTLLAAASGPVDWPEIDFVRLHLGVNQMTQVTNAGDGSGRLFLVRQTGTIWIVQDGQVLAEPFLDIEDRVNCCGERGLLGMAFAPDFAHNGRFYVYYSSLSAENVVERHFLSETDPNKADPDRSQRILATPDNVAAHNGGQLAFGPDGYMYIGIGEDGLGTNAQNPADLRGKLLRIQVEPVYPAIAPETLHRTFLPSVPQQSSAPFVYAIPPTNPFVQTGGYRPEIWALGLRNPWRFSFDSQTGDLYLGDVGDRTYEEVNYEPAGSPGGRNYGWPVMEGMHCHTNPSCNTDGMTLPVWEYMHTDGKCAIIGGVVYRGDEIPDLVGTYLYGDFCTGKVYGLRSSQDVWESAELYDADYGFSSFGYGEDRNVYMTEYASRQVRQLVPANR